VGAVGLAVSALPQCTSLERIGTDPRSVGSMWPLPRGGPANIHCGYLEGSSGLRNVTQGCSELMTRFYSLARMAPYVVLDVSAHPWPVES
jgi:hypothetical protein